MIPIILATITNNKDRHKAAELYEKYRGLMFKIAMQFISDKHGVEDVVSESAIKVLKHFEKIYALECYQQRRYIVNIVRSTCIDYLRKADREQIDYVETIEPDSIIASDNDSINPLDRIVTDEDYERVVTCIKELPETLKEVAYLSLVYGHSHNEIAEQLGINHANSKTRLSRAKEIIKKRLTGEDNGYKN